MDVRAGLGVVTVGVLAGEIAAARWQPPAVLLLGPPLALLLGWLAGGRRRRALLWGAIALAATGVGAARMRPITQPALPASHVARLPLPLPTTVTGRVSAAPDQRPGRTILLLEVETIGREGARQPASGRVRLAVRQPARRWRYGDRLRVDVVLRAPRNFENPGRFDYVGHLARRGVYVTAFVWDGAAITRLPARTSGLRAWLERWRARLARRIARAVPAPEGAVLRALVIGDEGAIDAELRDAFTRAGVVHVLSVSGLHIGLVAAGGFLMARTILGLSERLLLRVDVARLAAGFSLLPVAAYAALAGLGVATLRSAIMVAVAVLAGFFGRRVDILRSLALAALVLALLWPGTPLEIAFQLSFASVAAIVWGTRRLGASGSSWGARLRTASLVAPCALLGTAPLTAFHFHQVSLAGLIANPLAVPIFGSAVVGLGLTGALIEPVAPTVTMAIFRAGGWVLRPGIALVRAIAALPAAAIDVPIPSSMELLLCYVVLGGLFWLPRPAGRRLLALGLALLLADVAWWVYERRGTDRLRATFLDVGQGDAAVLELPTGGVIVVDGGGFPGGDFDTGAAIVSPFLLSRKIRRVDAVAMTHAHPDHSGGLPAILLRHRPREFWWTGVPGTGLAWDRLQEAVVASGARVRVLADGDPLPAFADGTTVLHPPRIPRVASLNDSSLTLRFARGAAALLLTGDIEANAERRLLLEPARLPSTFLKVPHHGSRTSSTAAFVATVAPAVAVMSLGADNRYRLPAPEVEARYHARGTCLLRTDRCGAIEVTVDDRGLRVRTRRPGCSCPPVVPD